jgi:hypothetical protein
MERAIYILGVDDDHNLLDGLKRILHSKNTIFSPPTARKKA